MHDKGHARKVEISAPLSGTSECSKFGHSYEAQLESLLWFRAPIASPSPLSSLPNQQQQTTTLYVIRCKHEPNN